MAGSTVIGWPMKGTRGAFGVVGESTTRMVEGGSKTDQRRRVKARFMALGMPMAAGREGVVRAWAWRWETEGIGWRTELVRI